MLENLSLYEAFQTSVKNTPFGKAVYYQGTQFSYRRFSRLVDRMADILVHQLNVKPKDVIMVAQPNIPDTLILIYAINKIGAIVNLVHPFTPYNQIRSIMEKTKTKIAFLFEQRVAKEVEQYRGIADRIYVTRVEDYLPIAKKNFYHIFMNKDIRKKLGKFRGKFKGFNYVYQLKPTGKPVETITGKSNEISVYLHSGSTTGEPKIICLCDDNFNFICDQTDVAASLPREELKHFGMLSVLPSFHGFGFCMTMHNSLTNSMNCILIPKYSPKEVVKTMNKTNVNLCVGVPTMFESLINYPPFVKSKKLKNWYVCFSGGDTLSTVLKERFDNVMKSHGSPCRVFEGYGLTESVAAISINTFEHNRDGSIGYPLHDVQIRIVDEKGHELPHGEIGEITIKSKATMVSYLNDEEATKKAVVDGWLYTGDLGYVDNDNYLFFKLRKKRVIKVSGVGVFPTEIEALVNHIQGVKGCCAIRIPDDRLQSAVKIFVVADYFDEQGMKDLILDTCRKYLIRWAVPKEIEFIEKLPMTMLNKVNFAKLQKEEDERRHLEG